MLFAPAMHTEMWQHAATQANVETLRSRGVTVLEPASGRLTGADSGPGRLPDPEAIFDAAMALAPSAPAVPGRSSRAAPLAGRTVTISAGGTREPLDPVRFLGQPVLRQAGRGAGRRRPRRRRHCPARSPPTWRSRPRPALNVVRVETALQLREAALAAAADSDVVIMAAAVADFRPAEISGTKIKKRDDIADPVITLVRNPDILQELVEVRTPACPAPADCRLRRRNGGRRRATCWPTPRPNCERKGCDLLVVNHVGTDKVFGQDTNSVVILSRSGSEPQSAAGSKSDVAAAVIDRISAELSRVVPHA